MERAQALLEQGRELQDRGDARGALRAFEDLRSLGEATGHKGVIGAAAGSLGSAYDSLGQYDKAVEHLTAALAISREIGDRRGEGSWLGNLGNAYFSLGQYEKAIEHHTRHHAIAEEIGCLLYTSPSPRDRTRSRMPSSA